MFDDWLAGIGGALSGGLKGYTWAKDREQDERILDERERARRDANNARSMDLMLDERVLLGQEEDRRDKRLSAERSKKVYDEWFKTLTPEMQRFFTAKNIGGVTTDAEDWKTAEQRELEKKDAAGQKYLEGELAHTRALDLEGARGNTRRDLEGTRHRNRLAEIDARRSGVPVNPPDDPALPMGVRNYLSSMVTKHQGNYQAAEGEWTTGFAEQQGKHPRLDPTKARKYLRDAFGVEPGGAMPDEFKKFRDELDARGAGGRPDATPGGDGLPVKPPPLPAMEPTVSHARPGALTPTVVHDLKAEEDAAVPPRSRLADPQRRNGGLPVEIKEGTGRPTAQPIEVRETTGGRPVSPRSPEAADDQAQRLEQQALSVIERYRVEKDPAKKKALVADLARLKGEIIKAQQKRPGAQ